MIETKFVYFHPCLTDKGKCNLSEAQALIVSQLCYLHSKNLKTTFLSSIAKRLGYSTTTIKNNIVELRKRGFISLEIINPNLSNNERYRFKFTINHEVNDHFQQFNNAIKALRVSEKNKNKNKEVLFLTKVDLTLVHNANAKQPHRSARHHKVIIALAEFRRISASKKRNIKRNTDNQRDNNDFGTVSIEVKYTELMKLLNCSINTAKNVVREMIDADLISLVYICHSTKMRYIIVHDEKSGSDYDVFAVAQAIHQRKVLNDMKRAAKTQSPRQHIPMFRPVNRINSKEHRI